ncbi:MAG: SDR family oxidoreductase [Firmicutes bacterium]|nr:SDR family oxidoreductase [Bacillota bacterium]
MANKEEKVYFVTGASGGIGSTICRVIAKNDPTAKILVHYHTNKKSAEVLNREIPNSEVFQCDFRNKTEVENLCSKILAKYPNVYGLVNCAGFVEDKDFADRTWNDFEDVFKVNLFAPFLFSQKLGEKMFKNKSGRIVNISSTNGVHTTYPQSVDYDASKSGLNNLTRNCAIEFAPFVSVNAIMPGWVESADMNTQLDKKFLESERKTILKRRFAKPTEIAEVVWFLLGDKGDYITGSILPVDGGIKIG